jgi:hypothetical protein
MLVCICGYESQTESELMSHFLECHRLSYGLGNCCSICDKDKEELPDKASVA